MHAQPSSSNCSVVIFRRDLRLVDNTAFIAAAKSGEEVLPVFIFNPAQTVEHRYRSNNGLAFLCESLEELSAEIATAGGKLVVTVGDPKEVLTHLIASTSARNVHVNTDYTPFSRERDRELELVCSNAGATFHSHFDLLLCDPTRFAKPDRTPYTVFTPFFKKASQLPIARPIPTTETRWFTGTHGVKEVSARTFWPEQVAPQRLSNGGRSHGLKILTGIKRFSRYEEERNLPAIDGTTVLAPHNKFGTLSIREVYHAVHDAFGPSHSLIRELYWRDFFTHIAFHFPHVFSGAFHRHYDRIEWSEAGKRFERWCTGTTGFPIVDAGMRQLVATGFMHNRVRMITASFLVKDLHISWREGEAFFARHLTDFDPAVNNGSWQWAASTGCDAQPYFRIFNPWLQQERFDPECVYIKQWIPELSSLSPRQIHKLSEESGGLFSDYPQPMVNHSAQKSRAEQMFADVRSSGESNK